MEKDIKFAADVMLGRLAQYLKLLGYSCTYRREFPDKQLIEYGLAENRIILTRDRKLAEQLSEPGEVLFIKTTSLRRQLELIKDNYGLTFDKSNLFSRCPDCDVELREVEKKTIKEQIPGQTSEWLDDYQQCPCCKKVYWQGTHYRAVCRRLKDWGLLDR